MLELIYKVLQPVAELRFAFDQIEQIEVPAGYPPVKVRFLPDDRFYFFLCYGNPFTNNLCGLEWNYKKQLLLSGITPYYSTSKVNGFSGIIAFRFTHCGFRCISNLNASSFYNKIVDAGSVFECKTNGFVKELLGIEGKQERIFEMEKFLLNFLKKPDKNLLKIRDIVDTIIRFKGNISIHHLAQDYNMSYTYLEKLFKNYVGVSPKMFCKLQVIKNFMELNVKEDQLNFTQLAHLTGYYDQSHFIKDFKRFTGMTPLEHKKAKKFFGDSFVIEDTIFI